MNLLMIGDVVGKPGRRAVATLLPSLRRELQLDFVIANGENAAAGRGLSDSTARELFDSGVDVITSGNHIWAVKEFVPSLDGELPVLRPLNYPPGAPGRGMLEHSGVTVLNLQGRTFMPHEVDDPFRAADAALSGLGRDALVIVDFHAETTSEKQAMGRYLDGRASVVVGTHTHVHTADEQIFPGGTAYITDVGMCGPHDSIIGVKTELALQRILTQRPVRFDPAEGDVRLHGVLVELDEETGKARSIRRVAERFGT